MNRSTFLSRVLYSPGEPRLRTGWRLLAQFALMVSAVFVLSLALIVANLLGLPYSTQLLINQLAIFIAVTLTVPFARCFLDHRPVVSLGLAPRHALPDLLAGFVIAGVVMGAIFVFEQWAGWLTIDSVAWQQRGAGQVAVELGVWLLIFALTGWQEELLARGYWLQNIAEAIGLRWGLLVSSGLFAVAHIANPNASWVAVLGLLAGGYFLAYGYLRTRQLWLPIGLHIGWNFFEGNIFGFPVSGLDTFRLVEVRVSGPDAWTGGSFGPEAGLIVLPAMLLGVGLMYVYTLRRQGVDDAPAPVPEPIEAPTDAG